MMFFEIRILFSNLIAITLYPLLGFLMLLIILRYHPIHFLTHIILNPRISCHSFDIAGIMSVVGHYRTTVTTT